MKVVVAVDSFKGSLSFLEAGAAGGLGFAFLSFLSGVELKSGIEIVLKAVELEKELSDADIAVTGEGRLHPG